jgi:3-deoxy-7-phosphoheptulonate synthase
MERTFDLNIVSAVPLITPRELKCLTPVSERSVQTVVRSREAIRRIISYEDDRLLGIVGPCSIHDRESALDYANRLGELARKLSDRIFLIMRVYFEKPRTTLGWRGLVTDPHLDGSYDIAYGLRLAREILQDITDLGVPVGSELLDPVVPQYMDDLISWAAIGARTTESQTHREMASGLSMPVGFKNGTDGSYETAVNALRSCRSPHSFIGTDQEGNTCVLTTAGNSSAHIISRGGNTRPNYSPQDIDHAEALLRESGIDPAILVDCSHGNSGKKHENQVLVLHAAVEQRVRGKRSIIGFMIESNLFEGSQEIPGDRNLLRYGVSVTDECVGWDATEAMLLEAYERLGTGKRRNAS